MTRSNRLKVLLAAASVAALTVLLSALFAPVQPADAAFPGQNGKLVFGSYMSSGPGVDNPEGDSEIFTINPDGTGLVQLTHNSGWDYDPAWSPDGESIAFSSDSGVLLRSLRHERRRDESEEGYRLPGVGIRPGRPAGQS